MWVCLSVYLCLLGSVWLSICVYEGLSVTLFPSLSIFLSRFMLMCLSIYHCLFLSVCVYVDVCLSACLCLCRCIFLTFSPCLFLRPSVWVFVGVSVCLSVCLSPYLCLCWYVCLSVTVFWRGGVQVNNASGHCGKRKRQTRISRTSCLCRKLRQCFNCNNPTTVAFQCQYIRVCSETSGYVMKTLNPGVLRGGVSQCLC